METEWKSPAELRYDFQKMYVGQGEEFDLNEEDQKLNHPHQVQDKMRKGFGMTFLCTYIWESCRRLKWRVIGFNKRHGNSS